jgi:hypothetical protein
LKHDWTSDQFAFYEWMRGSFQSARSAGDAHFRAPIERRADETSGRFR